MKKTDIYKNISIEEMENRAKALGLSYETISWELFTSAEELLQAQSSYSFNTGEELELTPEEQEILTKYDEVCHRTDFVIVVENGEASYFSFLTEKQAALSEEAENALYEDAYALVSSAIDGNGDVVLSAEEIMPLAQKHNVPLSQAFKAVRYAGTPEGFFWIIGTFEGGLRVLLKYDR